MPDNKMQRFISSGDDEFNDDWEILDGLDDQPSQSVDRQLLERYDGKGHPGNSWSAAHERASAEMSEPRRTFRDSLNEYLARKNDDG